MDYKTMAIRTIPSGISDALLRLSMDYKTMAIRTMPSTKLKEMYEFVYEEIIKSYNKLISHDSGRQVNVYLGQNINDLLRSGGSHGSLPSWPYVKLYEDEDLHDNHVVVRSGIIAFLLVFKSG